MENLTIYNAVRAVPENAKKQISAGRLKGMSDINPMWRIKTLTEQFGVCGFGWKYTITDKHMESGANGEIAVFVDIDLFVKVGDTWSEAIPGTGGSTFVAKEKNGLYTSDECYKMALTDAISVACKALGFGADVYWEKDRTRYTPREQPAIQCQCCGKPIVSVRKKSGEMWDAADMAKYSAGRFGAAMCADCMKAAKQEETA